MAGAERKTKSASKTTHLGRNCGRNVLVRVFKFMTQGFNYQPHRNSCDLQTIQTFSGEWFDLRLQDVGIKCPLSSIQFDSYLHLI